MYILEIIPIQKGIPRDSLSYYSVREIPLGALVEIPLNKKTIQGIVINRMEARDMKASIRSGNFSLKAVLSVIAEKGFPSKILQTLAEISTETFVPMGTLITGLFPEPIFNHFQKWQPITREKPEIRIIELPTTERFEYYKVLVREALGRNKSIHFITPTTIENDRLAAFLKEFSAKDSVIALSGGTAAGKREKIYLQLETIKTPLIICTTPQFFMIPRTDIGSCVIESSGSPYYIQDFKQHVDYRSMMVKLANVLGYTCYLSDSISSPEQMQLVIERKAFVDRTTKKVSSPAHILVMEKESMRDPFYVSPMFSSKTIELIKHTITEKKPLFIYSARKGIASVTTCRDCGYTVHCPNCNNIMQLIKKNPLADADRVFSCSQCATEVTAMNRCPVCLGWNLIPLGITTESVTEELKKFFPEVSIFQSTQDLTKTESACKKMVTAWQESQGILVGTQKIIPFINEIPVTIIASFEHCMSIPHFQTSFRTLWLFQKLHEKTTDYFAIQTKDTENSLLHAFVKHDIPSALNEDLALRKQYHFPPFATLVTIILDHIKRKDHTQAKEFLKKGLGAFEHSVQSQFFQHSQDYRLTAIVHIPTEDWQSNDHTKKQQFMNLLGSIRDHAEITIETGLK